MPARPDHRVPAHAAVTALAVGSGLGSVLGGRRLVSELIARQARRADVRVRPLVTPAPPARDHYGDPADPPITLALLGDSSAEGVGVAEFDETLGGHLGRALASRGHYVRVLVAAVNGARADDLANQVDRVLPGRPDLAAISVGANDVRNRTPPSVAAAQLRDAVAQLRDAGAHVVVGTTPDLGIVTAVPRPLRNLAGLASRRLERAQGAAVRNAGAVAVPLGQLLSPLFAADPRHFAPDGFHPSNAGYALIAQYLLPALLAAPVLDP